MASQPFVGIDFGTCNSSVAWFNPKTDQAEPLRNAEGEDKTPSVVYFGASEILVGKYAEERLAHTEARKHVVSAVKLELARPRGWLFGERKVSAVEVAAEILKKLKRDAEQGHFHSPVARAVITCPAVFDEVEKDNLRAAATLAGFRDIELLEEPVAAAFAYAQAGVAVGRSVLVYDLGGGTFDVALLVREDGEETHRLAMEPRGARLGGETFDRAVYDHFDQLVQKQLNRPLSATGIDREFLRQCRRWKETLSFSEATHPFEWRVPGLGTLTNLLVSRARLEQLIENPVERTIALTPAVRDDAAAAGFAVNTVILIGGSSRIPLILQRLQATLHIEPRKWEKQDIAVALGAAYHAQRLWGENQSAQQERQQRQQEETARQQKLQEEARRQAEQERQQREQEKAVFELDFAASDLEDTSGTLPGINRPANQVFTNFLGMKFAFVPRGKFWFGGGGGKLGIHQVEIPHDFYLGVYPVTQAEWQAIMENNPSHFSRTGGGKQEVKNISNADLRQFPVECVSWEDAEQFLRKINGRTLFGEEIGWTYRLPTETEWEYACRAGSTSLEDCSFDFYFARPTNEQSEKQANFENSVGRTTKVGSYPPNALGLYDMHGNVWEWCWCQDADEEKGKQAFRGGGWMFSAKNCTAAFRMCILPPFRESCFGLRLARVPRPIQEEDKHDDATPAVPATPVTGRVIVKGQVLGCAIWFKISLDRKVLGETRVWSGCDFPFRTTPGKHLLVVDVGILGQKDQKSYTLHFPEGGDYRITLKIGNAIGPLRGLFADKPNVQKMPRPR